MKINESRFNLEKFNIELNKLKKIFNNYKPGDFHSLGELSNSINLIYEFVSKNHSCDPGMLLLKKYFSEVYQKDQILILSDCNSFEISQGKVFNFHKYSRNNIIKYVRGAKKHGEIYKDRRQQLHEYIFETNLKLYPLYAVTTDFVRIYGADSNDGMHDTGGPYLEEVQTKKGKIKLSLIESLIRGIALEIDSILTKNNRKGRIIILNDLMFYKRYCGEEIYLNIINQIESIKKKPYFY